MNFNGSAALSEAAAELIITTANEAIGCRGRFTVALSGGSVIPIIAAGLLKRLNQTDTARWHIFWADERCVEPTSSESNFASANLQLLRHLNTPAGQIYPIEGTLEPAQAARQYRELLEKVFQPSQGEMPRFDLVVLGIGPDGHTASLFPNHPLLSETALWAAPIYDSPKPPPRRVTLTIPVINNAAVIAFIASGHDKKDVIQAVLDPKKAFLRLPAQLISPARGRLRWLTDCLD